MRRGHGPRHCSRGPSAHQYLEGHHHPPSHRSHARARGSQSLSHSFILKRQPETACIRIGSSSPTYSLISYMLYSFDHLGINREPGRIIKLPVVQLSDFLFFFTSFSICAFPRCASPVLRVKGYRRVVYRRAFLAFSTAWNMIGTRPHLARVSKIGMEPLHDRGATF